MGRYANTTSVSPAQSRQEIESTLARFGASQFLTGFDQSKGFVAFFICGRAIRMDIELPDRSEFTTTPSGRQRKSGTQQEKQWEQACRQKWRALALHIKGKLVAIDDGIATFEDEFLAYTRLPNGQNVSEWIQPQITKALESGAMPKMLPGF